MSQIENNPFKYDEFRVVPWKHLKEFEKSYIIYQAQNKFYLNNSELNNFVKLNCLNSFSWYYVPLFSYFAFYKGLAKLSPNRFTKNMSYRKYKQLCFGLTIFSWVIWSNYNPFLNKLYLEKEQLMRNLEYKISYELIRLNDMLPYNLTERRINFNIVKFYFGLNSVFNGILFNTHEFNSDKYENFNNPFK